MAKTACTLAAVLLLLSGSAAFAVEQTLFNVSVEHGFYVAPVLRVTSIDDRTPVLVGAQGGWIVNHKLVVGAGGYTLVADNISPFIRYGGAFFGYVAASDKLIHPTIQVLLGGGMRESRTYHGCFDDSLFDERYDHRTFLVLEPQFGIEVNVASGLRFEISGGYRYAGINNSGRRNSDINGPSGSFALKFGRF